MRHVRWMYLLLSLAALAGLLPAGCNTGIAEKDAERRIRERLPEIIGPARSYRVNIRASSDLSVIGGRLREVHIEGRRVRIGGQWPVDYLRVTLERVRVDVSREVLEEVGAARFQAGIAPPTLVQYVESGQENLRDVRVLLRSGRLVITGRYLLVRVWTPFEITGSLQLLGRTRIGFHTEGARAAGIRVPDALIRQVERRLNPVLDVSGALLPIDLTEIAVRPDAVVVSGIPDLKDPSIFHFPSR
ncbi:MAG: DUF2993 domain-containing protein [Armatimonadetes bacterium]|nr:DUF2993 domain-containing protein [Armatimonadota bacterium]